MRQSSQQFADTSTMDLDVSCHHNSDDEMPNEAGFSYFGESSADGDVDHVKTDDDFASANEDGIEDTSKMQPDCSLMCKYNTYLSSGLGQMKTSTAYQRDIELLRILTKAKAQCTFLIRLNPFTELRFTFRNSNSWTSLPSFLAKLS
jgi:hypothetical protein